MTRVSSLALVLAALPMIAHARGPGRPAAPPPLKVWIGEFTPDRTVSMCVDCKAATIEPHAGAVRVLRPSDDSPAATGEVVIASPLLGVIARGRIDDGRVAVAWFNYDRRDGNGGVLVLPGTADPRFVNPSAADVTAIRGALLRNEVLAGVRRAVAALEVGALDLDGDGKADLAVTYGCNAWADGDCQSHGQFFVARHGTSWSEIE